MQRDVSNAQTHRNTAQSRWEITAASPPDALPDFLNDSALRSLQEKLTELRRQHAELITIYTEKHTKVKQVQPQIALLHAAPQTERTAIVARIRNDYDTASHRERLPRAAYGNHSRLGPDHHE